MKFIFLTIALGTPLPSDATISQTAQKTPYAVMLQSKHPVPAGRDFWNAKIATYKNPTDGTYDWMMGASGYILYTDGHYYDVAGKKVD